MQYFLAIDNGGTVVKAGVYNHLGEEVAVVGRKAVIHSPAQGFVERDIGEMLLDLKACIAGVLKQARLEAKDIRAISVSCHGKGLYLVKKDEITFCPGIISSDFRAERIVAELTETGVAQRAYPISFQQLWTGHPVALLVWFNRYQPTVLEQADAVLMGHDLIRFYLTGELHAERSNMSGSGLVDVMKADYSVEILRLFGLEGIEGKLPPLVDSTDLCGRVTAQAAAETGLAEGTPVYGGFFDVVSSAVAAGLTNEEEINATMGTWSISTALSSVIPQTEYPYIWGNYCIEGKYFVHEGSPTSACNLEWLTQNLLQDCHGDYQRIEHEASQAPESNELYYLPYLYQSNLQPELPAGLFGLRAHHSRGDVWRAVYEGVVFAHKVHLDRLFPLLAPIPRISLTGGPTRSALWMQIFADTVERELVLPQCNEAGCKGAALAAMVGSGVYPNFPQAVAHTITGSQAVDPQPARAGYYREKFARFKQLANSISQLGR